MDRPEITVERTPEGLQTVLPGAERRNPPAVDRWPKAYRVVGEPQKPVGDLPLFSAERDQADLFG